MNALAPLNQVFELAQLNVNGSLVFGALRDGVPVPSLLPEDFAGSWAYAEQVQQAALDIYGDDRRAPPKPVGPPFDAYDLQPHLYIDDIPSFNRPGRRGQWLGLGYYRMLPDAYEVQHGPRIHVRTEYRGDEPYELGVELTHSGFNLRVIQEEAMTIGPEAQTPWGRLGVEISSRAFLGQLLGPEYIAPQMKTDPQVMAFSQQDAAALFQLALQICLSNPDRWWQGFTLNEGPLIGGSRYVFSIAEDETPYLVDAEGSILEIADYKPKRMPLTLESIAWHRIGGPKTSLLALSMNHETISIIEHILNPLYTFYSPRMSHLLLRTEREIMYQLARMNALSREDLIESLANDFGFFDPERPDRGPAH